MAVELGRQTETSSVTAQSDRVGSRSIWAEIELAESYLVCCMFEDAASTASCVLKNLCDIEFTNGINEDIEPNDMLESAGMVFVQSLKELGRASEIIKELMELYNSLNAIPVQVFLTGICFQMQEDPHGAEKILEEYLNKWRFIDEEYYVLETLETNMSYMEGCGNRFVLEVDTYLQVVEAYITILKDTDVAISWVEKAALQEHTRQELLRRLHSLHSSNSTSALVRDDRKPALSKTLEGDGNDIAILRYSQQHVPTFWLFRTLNIKFGSIKFAISNGSILLTALLLLIIYYMRRKKHTISSVLKGQVLFVKKAVMDLWQLAFSYQVNPLAAVEPLQNPTRVSR